MLARTLCNRHYKHAEAGLIPMPEEMDLAARTRENFWSRVEKGADCWQWKGAMDRNGYGRFSGRGMLMAHRYSYQQHKGDIPVGITVDHLCFNRGCVNPDHLRLLTRSENARNQQSTLRTHCKNGHPFDDGNTAVRRGSRRCKICRNEVERQWKLSRIGRINEIRE
jgi:hypothetical protein